MLVFNLACPNLLRRGDSMNRVIEEILGVISFITEAYIQQDNFPLKTHLLSQPFFEGWFHTVDGGDTYLAWR